MDIIATITAIGLLLGALTGSPAGYGVEVGAVIYPETGAMTIGVNPITYWDVPALVDAKLIGLTLGTTHLLVPEQELYRIDTEWMGHVPQAELANIAAFERRRYRATVAYEAGHREGWGGFGVGYILEMAADPCAWDPSAYWATCPGPRNRDGFAAMRTPGRIVPPQTHYALEVRVW